MGLLGTDGNPSPKKASSGFLLDACDCPWVQAGTPLCFLVVVDITGKTVVPNSHPNAVPVALSRRTRPFLEASPKNIGSPNVGKRRKRNLVWGCWCSLPNKVLSLLGSLFLGKRRNLVS